MTASTSGTAPAVAGVDPSRKTVSSEYGSLDPDSDPRHVFCSSTETRPRALPATGPRRPRSDGVKAGPVVVGWLSSKPDPVGDDGGNTNLYDYARQDPIN